MTSPGQTAYTRIREAIVEGRYRPGQRLIEQRIAEEIDLSRTPVREALRRLEAEGLIVSEPNRGAAVRSVRVDELTDLSELRARLEAYATELAAQRIDADCLSELDLAITAFGDALDANFPSDLERVRAIDDANHRIHRAIHLGAGHQRLAGQLERTTDVPLVFQAFRQYDATQTLRSHSFHQLIRDLIVAGDGQRAGALMYEHVLQGRDVLLAHLEAAGTDDVDSVFDIPDNN
ncbi:MAG: GntR family transcriptional regulator [Gordonia sp. (in: high G+C Gram-positive bacteria)]